MIFLKELVQNGEGSNIVYNLLDFWEEFRRAFTSEELVALVNEVYLSDTGLGVSSVFLYLE